MKSNATNNPSKPESRAERDSEEIVRQLEQFPVEALEAALIILADRKQRASSSSQSPAPSFGFWDQDRK